VIRANLAEGVPAEPRTEATRHPHGQDRRSADPTELPLAAADGRCGTAYAAGLSEFAEGS
jgi:hypothetical protein